MRVLQSNFLVWLLRVVGLVCRLCHSLYDLKQSSQTWFSQFSCVVYDFGITLCILDHSLFYRHISSGQCNYLIIYGDDIVNIGNDQYDIQNLKKHIFSLFVMKDLRKIKYFLGIEVEQSKSGIVMSQRKYVLNIVKETSMLDCKPVDTPIDANVKLLLEQEEPL